MAEYPQELRTERLLLRRWQESDRAPFARLNTDSQAVRYLPKVLTREESDRFVDRVEAHFEQYDYGLWVAEIVGITPFAGFIGFAVPTYEAHFTPNVEIGWRLAPEYWGQGYATEGAQAVLDFGFKEIGLEEIVSITVPDNIASWRVMEKIGMTRELEGDFDHPFLPEDHPLRRHWLFRKYAPPR